MKKHTTIPFFVLLPAAALAADVPAAATQLSAAVDRSVAGAVADQETAATQLRPGASENATGGTVLIEDEIKPFRFVQPKSTKEILPLGEKQLGELDAIGQAYVDLVDNGRRFEAARDAEERKLAEENEKNLEEAREAFDKARDAQYKAEGDLAAAQQAEIAARAKVTELDKQLAEVAKEWDEIDAAEKKDIEDADLKSKVLKQAESDEAVARKAAEKADKKKLAAAAEKATAAEKAAAAGKAKEEADATAEAARRNASETAKAAAAAAIASRETETSAAAAATARKQADRVLSSAEKTAAAAAKEAGKAQRTAEKAAAAAEKAAAAAKEAAEKASADKDVDPATLGWWKRQFFNPERSAARAAEAAARATEAKESATAAAAAAKDAVDRAKTADDKTKPLRAAAEAARALDETRRTAAKTAAEDAKKASAAAENAAAAAAAAGKAERAAADKAAADTAATAAAAAETETGKAAEKANKLVEELKAYQTRLEKETDPIAIAREKHLAEKDAKDEEKGRLLERKQAAEGELEEARKIDLASQKGLVEKAKQAREEAEQTFRKQSQINGKTSETARRNAALAERNLEKALDEKRDLFFAAYRGADAEKVYFGADNGPTVRKEAAEKAAGEAKEAAEKAAAAVQAAEKAAREKIEAVKAAKAAVKIADDAGKAAAETALEEAKAKAAETDEALKNARAEAAAKADEAKKAERNAAAAGKAVRRANDVLDDTVEEIKAAFVEQVEKAQAEKRNVYDRRTMTDGQKRRADARAAKAAYDEAKAALDEAKTAWNNAKAAYPGETGFLEAGHDYAEKRQAFNEAENRYQEFFGDRNTFETEPMTVEEADALYNADATKTDLFGYAIRGDRRWLAATSVNGENLLDTLVDEMLVAGLDAAESVDAGRIKLSPADAAKAAETAADAVRRRAVYGGFYFAGLAVDAAKKEIFVDKGRFGPINVSFVRSEDENPADEGRLFTADDILDKLGANASVDPVKEGEAFNFVRFREMFNALNANPDIRRADVEFRASDDYDYGYEDEDPGFTDKNTRAITADLNVRERGFPAPIHGVVGVDNFNSMGESDAIAGEADTWMARATLQHLDLFGLGHALTLSGNYSLGGALWGAAASYYIPRETGSKWSDGAWHRLSGWSWTVHGGYTDVDQADVVPDLDVLGTGYYAGIAASSRVADFGGSTLDLALGFTWRYVESSVRVGGQEIMMGPNEGDGYTLMPLSIALMYADKDLDVWRGRTFATAELAYNLGGSTADELRYFRYAIDDNRYLVARLQLARLQLLWEESQSFLLPRVLFLKADAQWASAPVVGTEQFGLGGHSTVRGYVERQFMGDTGAAGTIEFRTPIGLGWLDSSTPDPFRASDRIQLVYFADLGWFTLEDGLGTGENDSEFLASLGFGLRYSWDDLVLRLDWGYPLVTDDAKFESSSAGVIHASMQYQF